jgi:Tol biopolymer transport system component
VDLPGPFSVDGEKIAFLGITAGSLWQLFVANRDGTDMRRVVPVAAQQMEIGSWSPDGLRIVFDAAVGGNSDIYVIAENGGEPKRLTVESSTDVLPSWSQDGQWVYFSSNRTGRHEVWKVPAEGGSSIQVTRNGGFQPRESLDGGHILYLEDPPLEGAAGTRWISKLKMARADGSEEQVVINRARSGLWAVTSRGVLFLSIEPDFDAIDLYQFPDGSVKRMGRLPFRIPRVNDFGRVVFSRDGRWALTNQVFFLTSSFFVALCLCG